MELLNATKIICENKPPQILKFQTINRDNLHPRNLPTVKYIVCY